MGRHRAVRPHGLVSAVLKLSFAKGSLVICKMDNDYASVSHNPSSRCRRCPHPVLRLRRDAARPSWLPVASDASSNWSARRRRPVRSRWTPPPRGRRRRTWRRRRALRVSRSRSGAPRTSVRYCWRRCGSNGVTGIRTPRAATHERRTGSTSTPPVCRPPPPTASSTYSPATHSSTRSPAAAPASSSA